MGPPVVDASSLLPGPNAAKDTSAAKATVTSAQGEMDGTHGLRTKRPTVCVSVFGRGRRCQREGGRC